MVMTHISLFTGIGGIDIAAEWAGFKTILFVEKDDYCQKVLRKHWPDVPIIGDIKDVNTKSTKEHQSITLITGGFPCQPVSQAGKRRGKEDDRWLWPEMLRVIKEVRPRWVVGENVAGLINMGLDNCISDLESEGYTVQPYLIPACAVNAPHRRDRIFIVAHTINSKHSRGRGQDREEDRVQGEVRQALRTRVSSRTSQDVADSGHIRQLVRRNKPGTTPKGDSNWQGQKPTCQSGYSYEWWATEPELGRVVDGIPNRVDRLRCLGNAVVPQQIYPILKAISKIEGT